MSPRVQCDRDHPGRLSMACRSGAHHRCAMAWCECPAHGRAEPEPEPAAVPEPRPAPRRDPDEDDERDRRWWDL